MGVTAELAWGAIVLVPLVAAFWAGLRIYDRHPVLAWCVALALWFGGTWGLLELALQDRNIGWQIEKRLDL